MATMSYKKDELIYLARLAEQCERYDGKSETRHTSYLV